MEDILRFDRENTVSPEKQVNDVIICSAEMGSPKILFVGNSITLHGVKPDIGWHWLWGMAASDREKDYVHQTVRMAREIRPAAGYMIAQAASWELGFWLGEEKLENVKAAREYNADIIVFRIGENIIGDHVKEHDLLAAYERMMDFFNPTGKARMIVTDLFWPVPEKDAIIEQAAKNKGAAFVSVSHLGTQDEMKAIGLFEHAGVAAHPGDLGMLKIAEAIFEAMKPML